VIIPATFEALELVTDYMMQLAAHVDAETRSQLVLAVHELCMNIVQHAYAGDDGMIDIRGGWDRARLDIDIWDQGRHHYVTPDEIRPPNIHDYPESGWGIYIVHQVMDSVHYERADEQNHWHLVKYFTA
jgi:serine/threonine-protein kinase RsbW